MEIHKNSLKSFILFKNPVEPANVEWRHCCFPSVNTSWTQLLLKLKRDESPLMTSFLGHRARKMRPSGELGKECLRQLPQGQVLSEASYSLSLHMCLSLIFEITFPKIFFTSISVTYFLFLRGLQNFFIKGPDSKYFRFWIFSQMLNYTCNLKAALDNR